MVWVWTVYSRASLRKTCLQHRFELQLCLLCQMVGTPYWRPQHARENIMFEDSHCWATWPCKEPRIITKRGQSSKIFHLRRNRVLCNDSYPRTCPYDMLSPGESSFEAVSCAAVWWGWPPKLCRLFGPPEQWNVSLTKFFSCLEAGLADTWCFPIPDKNSFFETSVFIWNGFLRNANC